MIRLALLFAFALAAFGEQRLALRASPEPIGGLLI